MASPKHRILAQSRTRYRRFGIVALLCICALTSLFVTNFRLSSFINTIPINGDGAMGDCVMNCVEEMESKGKHGVFPGSNEDSIIECYHLCNMKYHSNIDKQMNILNRQKSDGSPQSVANQPNLYDSRGDSTMAPENLNHEDQYVNSGNTNNNVDDLSKPSDKKSDGDPNGNKPPEKIQERVDPLVNKVDTPKKQQKPETPAPVVKPQELAPKENPPPIQSPNQQKPDTQNPIAQKQHKEENPPPIKEHPPPVQEQQRKEPEDEVDHHEPPVQNEQRQEPEMNQENPPPVISVQDQALQFANEWKAHNLLYWLRADHGIQLDSKGKVESWASFDGQLFEYWDETTTGLRSQLVKANDQVQYVQFGCSLALKNIRLMEPLTLYVVFKPDIDSKEQRLLGHFPNGGFIYARNHLQLKTRHGMNGLRNNKLRSSENDESQSAIPAFTIQKFRISSVLETGTGFADFVDVGAASNEMFSQNKKLTIGGTNGGCSEFKGGIAEILLFQEIASTAFDKTIVSYLAEKYQTVLAPGFVKREDASVESVPVKASKECIDYGSNDRNRRVREWNPPFSATTEQKDAWQEALHAELVKLGRVPLADKQLQAREMDQRLRKEREIIFGRQCSKKELRGDGSKTDTDSKKPGDSDKSPIGMDGGIPKTGQCQRPYQNDILQWKPPSKAPEDLKRLWFNKVRDIQTKIDAIKTGGDELIATLLSFAKELNEFRDRMFSNICDDVKAPPQSVGEVPVDKNQEPVANVDDSVKETDRKQEQHSAASKCSVTNSVIEWVPPSNVPASAANEWKNEVKKAWKKINEFKQGGNALNLFFHELLGGLTATRKKLFASYCNNI